MDGMKIFSAIGPIADIAMSMKRPGRAAVRGELLCDSIRVLAFLE